MITEKRKEQEIISVLAPDHRKRIGKSKARDRSRNHELIFVSQKKIKKKIKNRNPYFWTVHKGLQRGPRRVGQRHW